MIALLWNFSVAIRGYLRFYMPTNRALDWLRSWRGTTWVVPVALVATLAYLYAMKVAAVMAAQPGLGWMNVWVVLCCWNALKFFWMAILSLPRVIGVALSRHSLLSAEFGTPYFHPVESGPLRRQLLAEDLFTAAPRECLSSAHLTKDPGFAATHAATASEVEDQRLPAVLALAYGSIVPFDLQTVSGFLPDGEGSSADTRGWNEGGACA